MPSRPRFPREWTWPGGHRVAVTVGVPFEAFINQSQFSYIGTPGKKDNFSLSYGDYAWKAGIWRMLNVLDEFGVKASMSTNGLAAERHPEIVRMCAGEGHEVNGHGWANDVYAKDASAEVERADIRRCTEVLESVTGTRPVGWSSPGSTGSDHTASLLREQGYLWHGDDVSDDLPFLAPTGHGPLVILPRQALSTNDISHWVLSRNPPSVMWEGFMDTFDTIYAEAQEEGQGRWIDITLHAHMAGRPTLIPTIRRMLSYARDHEGVFHPRKCDIAEWALQRLGN